MRPRGVTVADLFVLGRFADLAGRFSFFFRWFLDGSERDIMVEKTECSDCWNGG